MEERTEGRKDGGFRSVKKYEYGNFQSVEKTPVTNIPVCTNTPVTNIPVCKKNVSTKNSSLYRRTSAQKFQYVEKRQ
jgi:hypothetical protein